VDPTIQSTDAKGNRYDETSPDWKKLCQALPSFKEVWWPDYATTVLEDKIDGHDVIIQPWKGWCQQFMALDGMPGGVGAEVGIYRRIPGKTMPDNVAGLPDGHLKKWAAKVAGKVDNDLWWAYPELNAKIEFTLINPATKGVVLKAGLENTYWLNKWMNSTDYDAHYKANYDNHAPFCAWDYWLAYWINGKSYPVWQGHN
jgi:hypothetical protein